MKRVFIPGERWIYYKIYCGPYTAQEILINEIVPLIKPYIEANKILKWFFVRYSDPEFHLRIRIEINDNKDIPALIQTFSEMLGNLIDSNTIWNVDLSTYKRELERYGENNMTCTESFFFLSSTKISNLLIQDYSNDDYSVYVLKSVDEILSMFGLSIDDKLAFAKANRDYFKKEFEYKRNLNKILNNQYSWIQAEIDNLNIVNLVSKNSLSNPYNNEESDILINCIKENLEKTNITLMKFLSSLIHMHLNRAFMDDIRYYEYIAHSLLYKHYSFIKVTKTNIEL